MGRDYCEGCFQCGGCQVRAVFKKEKEKEWKSEVLKHLFVVHRPRSREVRTSSSTELHTAATVLTLRKPTRRQCKLKCLRFSLSFFLSFQSFFEPSRQVPILIIGLWLRNLGEISVPSYFLVLPSCPSCPFHLHTFLLLFQPGPRLFPSRVIALMH